MTPSRARHSLTATLLAESNDLTIPVAIETRGGQWHYRKPHWIEDAGSWQVRLAGRMVDIVDVVTRKSGTVSRFKVAWP